MRKAISWTLTGLMMTVGALMIVYASGVHVVTFAKTKRPRYLLSALATLPAVILLLWIVFQRL